MNNIGNRIKEVRKAKHLTQQKFADELGLKRNTVGGYEINTVTPSDRTISDICQKFNISESWLRTGEGDMFTPVSRDKEIESFINSIMKSESDDFRRRMIAVLSKLDSAEWKLLESMALKLAAEAEAERTAPKKMHVIKIAGRDGSFEERTTTSEDFDNDMAAQNARPVPDGEL